MASAGLAETTRSMLELIPDSFRLFPLRDIEPPRSPNEWSGFLLQHPRYVDGRYKAVALCLAEDRLVLEGMSDDYQKLGGALIRVMFSNEELIDIHNDVYGKA